MPGKCRETAGTFTGLESGTIAALAVAGVVLGPVAVAGRPAGTDPTDRRDCQASGALSVERTALEWNVTGDRGRALSACPGPWANAVKGRMRCPDALVSRFKRTDPDGGVMVT